MKWGVELTRAAVKDLNALTPKLRDKAKDLIREIACDPSIGKPLVGDLKGFFSIRLTLKDRIVYKKEAQRIIIVILRCKTHYGE